MSSPELRRLCLMAGAGLFLMICACGDRSIDWSFLRPQKDAPAAPGARPASRPVKDPVLAETVGSEVVIGGLEGQRVQGFGIVVGLGDTGSTDAPTAVREYLSDFLRKEVLEKVPGRDVRGFSANDILDSPDSAVVEVVGHVPAGAPKGTFFDVQVTALAGTSTRSIEGGLLLPCELKPAPPGTGPSEVLAARTIARASGPIFTNPFSAGADAADPRRGSVLGGGRSGEPRPVRLMLVEPSYALARRMEQRINERFGQRPRAAEALSKGTVLLHTPMSYLGKADRFIQLATHLYIQNQPAYVERRIQELSSRSAQPGASLESVALIWEGLGRTALPHVQSLFGHATPALRYYAARTALRLKDSTALPLIAEIAASPGHPQRIPAIRELGECMFPQAARDLVPLLDADDQEVRIAAYEALLQLRHNSITSRRFDCLLDASQLNFVLDIVKCGGRPMIYVRRTRVPRITVFGENMAVAVPIFYSHPQDWVTINARSSRDDLMLMSRPRLGGPRTLQLSVAPRVADLVAALGDLPTKSAAGRLRGLGLSYSQVVGVLDALCTEGSINARLVLEQTPMSEVLGPETPFERPEADEPGGEAPETEAPDTSRRRMPRDEDAPRLVPRPPPETPADPIDPPTRPEGGR